MRKPAAAMLLLCAAALSALTALPGCAGGGKLAGQTAKPAVDLGPLPGLARHASATANIPGADYDLGGDGASINGATAVLDSTGLPYAWARYAYLPPLGSTPTSISVDTPSAGPFWIALADYGKTQTWEWHGPFGGLFNGYVDLGGQAARYLSPAGTLFWVLVAAPVVPDDPPVSVTVTDCVVSYNAAGSGPEVPPAGTQTIDLGMNSFPSLVLMPDTGSGSAPVIAFQGAAGDPPEPLLYIAYYTGGAWQVTPVLPALFLTKPQARWLPARNEGIVVAFDTSTGNLKDLRFDANWQLTGSADIFSGATLPLANVSLDVDPATGELGCAYAFSDRVDSQLYYSWTEAGVWNTSGVLHSGDGIAGIAFRFDPQAGNDPWLLYAHGTYDNSGSFPLIDFTLENGRQSSGVWSFTPQTYPDSPLGLKLMFNADNSPHLAMQAVRLYHDAIFTYTIDASILLDGVVGDWNGTDWDFTTIHEATAAWSVGGFPPDTIIITLSEAGEINWAKRESGAEA